MGGIMFEIKYYLQKVNELIDISDEVYINSFLTKKQLNDYATSMYSDFYFDKEYVAIGVNDQKMYRIFYCATRRGLKCLSEYLCTQITSKQVVIDIVWKEDKVIEQKLILTDGGLRLFAEYSRWSTNKIEHLLDEFPISCDVKRASMEDTSRIYKIIYDEFEPLTDHLPSVDKVRTLINDNLVFCAQYNNDIIGVVCIENLGKKSKYVYIDVVVPKYKNTGVGICMLQYAFKTFPNDTLYTSWTDNRNKASNRMHKFFGFTRDGLIDNILITDVTNRHTT